MLTNANKFYSEQEFVDLDLSKFKLELVNFENCIFNNCQLPSLELVKCVFLDCKFENCNLSLAKLNNSSFRKVEFIGCKLTGVQWSQVSSKLGFEASFSSCILDYSEFGNLNLPNLQIINCSCQEVYFANNNLIKSSFVGSNLIGATFENCDLREADFRAATNYQFNLSSNKLQKAKFNLPEAISILKNLGLEITWEK